MELYARTAVAAPLRYSAAHLQARLESQQPPPAFPFNGEAPVSLAEQRVSAFTHPVTLLRGSVQPRNHLVVQQQEERLVRHLRLVHGGAFLPGWRGTPRATRPTSEQQAELSRQPPATPGAGFLQVPASVILSSRE